MEKMTLDLPLLLPDVVDEADQCVDRLLDALASGKGVLQAHVRRVGANEPRVLCIHYDPAVISLERIRELAFSAGAGIHARYGHLAVRVDGVRHARHARMLEGALRDTPGVIEASASETGSLSLEFDREVTDAATIRQVIAALGLSIGSGTATDAGMPADVPAARREASVTATCGGDAHDGSGKAAGTHDHQHDHGGIFGERTELVFALTCGALLLAGYLLGKFIVGVPDWVPTVLYVAAYFFGGYYTLREAVENVRLKRFEIDSLMIVAAIGAAALGAWAEGALLLFLFSIGHALENHAMGRAKRAIEALAELAPETANVRRDGRVVEVPVEALEIGDVVVVKPNERLPADGFLVAGISSVNQAPVTGESIPVDKQPVSDSAWARSRPDSVDAASRVFAGTINGSGAIEIEVTRKSGDSALSKVVRMVSEAETRKSPTQRFTERFERVFVPSVLVLVVLLLFAGVVIDEPFRDTFYRAMAVLVAASPCALAIATPSAVLSGIARAARGGVLIKGGGPLEELGGLKAMAFDKTGTLTEGKPRITDVLPVEGVDEEELLSTAVAVEALSDHPLAAAIVSDGTARLGDRPIPEASGLEALVGRGLRARLQGEEVLIGKAEMFGADGIAPLSDAAAKAIAILRDGGRTSMAVRSGNRDLGVIGMMDTPREAARTALRRLSAMGIERKIMISGDHQKVAEAIAREVGLEQAIGDLMPEDKVEAIRKLRKEAPVAMVGDGVNDAPAMAHATVGIAMGAAGSDVALETADVALMADDLGHLPFAVGLSRRTRRIIRQNVVVSLGVVAILIPATIFGLGIGPAVALHEGSTLLVVFNALRLLVYRDRA